MNRILIVSCVLLCTAGGVFSDPSDEENLALVNRVQARVAAGDTAALNELAAVPAKHTWSALVAAFRKNRKDATVNSKCAQLMVTVPGGEEHVLRLLKSKAANNDEYGQHEIAINWLVLNHDRTSVRILGSTLDEVDPEEIAPLVIGGLAALNPPGSPIVPKGHDADPTVLTQWKQWWRANKANYAGEVAPK
jgi:hypothetical protein